MKVHAPLEAAILVLAACSGGGQPASSCTPGATQPCTCTNGLSGAQTCTAAGTYGACECTSPIDARQPDAPHVDSYVPRLGVDWTRVTAAAPFGPLESAVMGELGGQLWLLAASAWHSPDGATWTAEAGTLAFTPVCAVGWNNALWVFGNSASLYSSTDGVQWNTVIASGAAFGTRNVTSTCFVFNNELWIGGGPSPSLYHSADGTTWNLASNLDDNYAVVLSYQNALWQFGHTVAGSYVKTSPDGVTWTSVNLAAPFTTTMYGRGAVAGNKMWLVVLGSGNDAVWSTTTGLDFVDVQSAPPFGAREYFGLATFDPSGTLPRLWLVGGYGNSNVQADIWVSPAP